MIKETTEYESFEGHKGDRGPDLTHITNDSPPEENWQKTHIVESEDDVFKRLIMAFDSPDDYVDFQKKIGQAIPKKTNTIHYPSKSSLDIEGESFVYVPEWRNKTESKGPSLSSFFGEKDDNVEEWKKHWWGMPEFHQENNPPFKKITVLFDSEDDYLDFQKKIDQELTLKTKSAWHPKPNRTPNWNLRWVDDQQILPKHPVYIISKGRHESMITSKSLTRMKVPHYIAIEPQDMENYQDALVEFGLSEYVTLLELPFSNHGDGPGRARNWCWDHSIEVLNAEYHWVLDDNLFDFYRLENNKRIRVESGAIFRAAEDFVERYENVPVSGFQYRFFIAPDSKYPAFVKNTRIYSTLLIKNDCPHRWRGRYNEDTDLSLQVLKDPRGFSTIQFNAFLQGKAATQTVSGGNTAEFYHAESVDEDGNTIKTTDKSDMKWNEGVNAAGTVNKSQWLKEMHPDGPVKPGGSPLVEVVWKYKRWHHYVDYGRFKNLEKNQLRLKPDVIKIDGTENYNMKLIDNYGIEDE